ncbi:MAG: pseudouridine synthase, partial [Cyclobacteriaceae bacterium]
MKLSPKSVLYEDNHLLVVNKPAGLLVQGDKTGDETLADQAKAYLKEKYNKPGDVFLGIVHRIDRPVSGVVVLARTSKALERLNASFRDRKVEKVYWALVQNRPPKVKGHCEHYILKNRKSNKSVAYNKPGKGALKSVLD